MRVFYQFFLGFLIGGYPPKMQPCTSFSLTRIPLAPPYQSSITPSHSIPFDYIPPTTAFDTVMPQPPYSSDSAPAGTIAPGHATTTMSSFCICFALVTNVIASSYSLFSSNTTLHFLRLFPTFISSTSITFPIQQFLYLI